MTFERHGQLAVLGRQVLFQQQAHRRGPLQGNKIFGEQLVPADFGLLGQRGIGWHHGHKAIQV
ncbi:hypothetical protein D3C85_1630550 [compost metagenome]